MKQEDFEKFKKDKIEAEVLEKKKQITRLTIRSKAAKAIERISGIGLYSRYIPIFFYRKIPKRSVLCSKTSIREVP